jgi:hypothetical protein
VIGVGAGEPLDEPAPSPGIRDRAPMRSAASFLMIWRPAVGRRQGGERWIAAWCWARGHELASVSEFCKRRGIHDCVVLGVLVPCVLGGVRGRLVANGRWV